MKCENCGAALGDDNICPKCGWTLEERESSLDNENEIDADIDSLDNLVVDFDEIDGEDESEKAEFEEDEFGASDDELAIDFDEINKSSDKSKGQKGGSSWLVAFVSFIAGVLATLITIGCFNGTIIGYFDRITNGSPKECVESFCKFYYQTDSSAKKMTKVFSPYLRAHIISELKSYVEYAGISTDVNLDIDVTKDSEFEKVAEYYLNLVTSSSTQQVKITNLKFNTIEYYKSGTDEFNSYLSEYKSSSDENAAKADGVSVFAKVSFKINYTVENIPQSTTVTEQQTTTDKNNADSKNDATAATDEASTTEQTTTTSVEEETDECVVICVKVNDNWQVFNGMQTSGSEQ